MLVADKRVVDANADTGDVLLNAQANRPVSLFVVESVTEAESDKIVERVFRTDVKAFGIVVGMERVGKHRQTMSRAEVQEGVSLVDQIDGSADPKEKWDVISLIAIAL